MPLAIIAFASCSGPAGPTDVGPATAPVIQSILVPVSRVEAGTEVTITAVVEDAETPLSALTFLWSTNVGSITSNGPAATWRMPPGITSGVDVIVALTVFDTYDAIVNKMLTKQQFITTKLSTTFRVHDSAAEVKALARKFLVDLFGNSSVPAEACMVDFADVCANLGEGKNNEVQQIVAHREGVVLTNAQVLNQRHEFFGPEFGTVHNAMLYTGYTPTDPTITSGCGDFELTMVYVGNRWWICESFFNDGDLSFCPGSSADSEMTRLFRKVMGRGKIPGGIRR